MMQNLNYAIEQLISDGEHNERRQETKPGTLKETKYWLRHQHPSHSTASRRVYRQSRKYLKKAGYSPMMNNLYMGNVCTSITPLDLINDSRLENNPYAAQIIFLHRLCNGY